MVVEAGETVGDRSYLQLGVQSLSLLLHLLALGNVTAGNLDAGVLALLIEEGIAVPFHHSGAHRCDLAVDKPRYQRLLCSRLADGLGGELQVLGMGKSSRVGAEIGRA